MSLPHPMRIAKDYKPYQPKAEVWWRGLKMEKPVKNCKKKSKKHSYKEESRMSLSIGKSHSYFTKMREENPYQYRTIQILGKGDIVNGLTLLEEIKVCYCTRFLDAIARFGNISLLGRLVGSTSLYNLKKVCSKNGTVVQYNALQTIRMAIKVAEIMG